MTKTRQLLSAEELIGLLEGSTAETVKIDKNTILFIKPGNKLPPSVMDSALYGLLAVVKKATGLDIGVMLMPQDVVLEEMSVAELTDMKYKIDVLLSHLARKSGMKEMAN